MSDRIRLSLLCALLVCSFPAAAQQLQRIRFETIVRVNPGGTTATVDLYSPSSDRHPAGGYPLVVLSHGFARSPEYHSKNAKYLASRGFVVAVPEDTRAEAIADLVGDIAGRSTKSREEPLGMVDVGRIGLAGHSAGGAASIEAAEELQGTSTPVAALCLLDAVPFPWTRAPARELNQLPLSSLRAEPSSCNWYGNVVDCLKLMGFPTEDIRVVGSTHCDQEYPSDEMCGIVCGPATTRHQQIFRNLMYLFFRDALGAPRIRTDTRSYADSLEALQKTGAVVRTAIPGRQTAHAPFSHLVH